MLKSKYVVTFLIVFLIGSWRFCSAQPQMTWSHAYGGQTVDNFHQVIPTQNGGYLAAGNSKSFGAGSIDFYLVKMNAAGHLVWQHTYGTDGGGQINDHCVDDCQDMTACPDGGFALAGHTDAQGAGSTDFYLIQVDNEGEQQWSNTYGGERSERCYSVLAGRYYEGYSLCGYTRSFGEGGQNAWLVKTDEEGEALWSNTYGGAVASCEFWSHVESHDGGYVLCGQLNDYHREDDNDYRFCQIYIVKTDANGEEIWSRTYGEAERDAAADIVACADGSYAVCGMVTNTDQGRSDADFFLLKISPAGDLLWLRNYGGEFDDVSYGLEQCDDGGFILTGYHSFDSDNDGHPDNADLWLLRTDSDGELLWSGSYGRNRFDSGSSVIQTANGGYVVVGGSQDPDGEHREDAYILKTTPDELNEVNDVGEINVPLHIGWNMISINVTPDEEFWDVEDGPDIVRMTEQFRVDENHHHIQLMKNGRGAFYSPEYGFNSIPCWNLMEGYLILADEEIEATWSGAVINPHSNIYLSVGWNMISYLPGYELDVSEPYFYGISPIMDYVDIMKDGTGHFVAAEWGFSNMTPLHENQGYQIKVTEDIVFNYPSANDQIRSMGGARNAGDMNSYPSEKPVSSSQNMSVLISSIQTTSIIHSGQVGAFSGDDVLVGLGTINADGRCGIAVQGDDPLTTEDEGLSEGESFELRLFNTDNKSSQKITVSNFLKGSDLRYSRDGFVVLDAQTENVIPSDFALTSIFPNPFNSSTTITYTLPGLSPVTLQIYNTNGQLVDVLADGVMPAGRHSVAWNGDGLSAGVYLVRMMDDSGNLDGGCQKVMLLK